MPVALTAERRRKPPVSPSEFFPPRNERQSRGKRMRLAMKNWLNGLPVNEDEDVLMGVDSEQAINRPPNSPTSIDRKRKKDIFMWKKLRRRRKHSNRSDTELITMHHEDSTDDLKKDPKKDEKIDRAPIRLIQIPPPVHHHHLPWQNAPPEGFDKRDDLFPYSITNRIKTAKYSLLTFLPKNICEQFRRVANIYFLFIVILQAIPVISNYNVGLAALPLIIIVSITAIKDGFEDYKRYKQDQQVNYAITKILKRNETPVDPVAELEKSSKLAWLKKIFARKQPTLPTVDKLEWQPSFWQDVRVGDIVYLGNNEMIPADVLILSTSEPDGVCYIETKNLDGETNLKVKRGPNETSWIHTADDAVRLKGQMEVELPSSNLYSFLGRLVLDENHSACSAIPDKLEEESSFVSLENGKVIPVDANALLLRGCVLRNTNHMIGLVVYTGPHTKLILNAGGTPSKRSRIERQMNPQIILNFVLLFIICLVCAVVQGVLASGIMASAPYWVSSFQDSGAYSSSFAGFLTFWSSVILFQTLVPISLYLTVELCKTAQAFLIHSDEDMYDVASDSVCVPRAWNLSDDLGQIQYLFSDKTGTLTRNIMEFRRISIGGKMYGFVAGADGNLDALKGHVAPDLLLEYELEMTEKLTQCLPYKYVPPSKQAFVDPSFLQDLLYDEDMGPKIREFFILLVVCHTVLIDERNSESASPCSPTDKSQLELFPHRLVFKAQSPDEATLVSTSRDLGFVFLGRQQAELTVSIMGKIEKMTVLHVLEFNSTRKRMSIIVRRADGRILLYTKGADSIIYDRLLVEEADSDLGKTTIEHLDIFAEDGLRTLCLAYKELSPGEYYEWSKTYLEASIALHDRDLLVEAACEELEKGLYLLGASAIEDRLADGVPECIEKLQVSGIKIWVLTGDKLETAINIGFSCRLLTRDMFLLTLRNSDATATQEQLRLAYEQIWRQSYAFDGNQQPCALIIEGGSLKHALSPQSRRLFLELSSKCKAVICCRVSPLQKAQVVQLVRRGKHAMTMAIGDGANDVSMLQAADIGVGIAGQEGMQAVMSSDYALAQFKHLSKLLLVHGRWSYLRTAEVTLQSFYKNILFVVLLFWYQFDCGFTAEYVYDYMYLMFFNLLFSVVPLLVLGIVDRDLEAPILINISPIYQSGIRPCAYNMKLFGLYVLDAAYQSLICFFIPRTVLADNSLGVSGITETKALLGNVMALSIIVSCNLYMVLNTLSWTWLTFASIPVSILVPVAFLGLYSLLPGQELYGSALLMLEQPLFWATILVTIVCSLTPRVLIKYLQSQFRPTDLDISRELIKYGKAAGEAQLRNTIEPLIADRTAQANTTIEVGPAMPQRLVHRETSKDLSTSRSEDLPEAPQLTRTPSSFLAESLRRRLVPLGSGRASRLRVFNLRTGRFEKITGFAYSQDEGMRRLIEGTAVPAFGTSAMTDDVIKAPPSAKL